MELERIWLFLVVQYTVLVYYLYEVTETSVITVFSVKQCLTGYCYLKARITNIVHSFCSLLTKCSTSSSFFFFLFSNRGNSASYPISPDRCRNEPRRTEIEGRTLCIQCEPCTGLLQSQRTFGL